ncbi:MAG TPA: glycosyltransferase family 2 protein [Chitinophagaceae bacterium]|nr:glycosyltransferase family 2 protein [Chitinophagaceae bacterium]
MVTPLVSICIPTYKKPDYVFRCLQSIAKQDYKNIEVIITDDSPDESIKQVAVQFNELTIQYTHNKIPLNSPANWNSAIRKANGDLFMLLHQDDWLHATNAISLFVNAFTTGVYFVFGYNIGIDEKGTVINFQKNNVIPDLSAFPEQLIIRNVIGPPSNVMMHKSIHQRYDEALIWLVDIDYYIAILKRDYKYHYLKEHLVSIGIHEDQTTAFVKKHTSIILKENLLLAIKIKDAPFSNIALYDYYWRLLRNRNIHSFEQVEALGLDLNLIPRFIKHMISFQNRFGKRILKIGVVSKMAMAISYVHTRLMK